MFSVLPALCLLLVTNSPSDEICPSPEDVLSTFQLSDERLIVELAAAEPNLTDPVAMTFDADGRLYVVEMADFQIGPDGEDGELLGRVRQLRDTDGDGHYETATHFADKLPLPTAITPAYGGILVGAAPDLLFLKDLDGDGTADLRKTLFTGFGKKHNETLLNSLYWGIDNWLYGCGNISQGRVSCPDAPNLPPVDIQDFRLRFRLPLEARTADDLALTDVAIQSATGGGQFGMAEDAYGRRFSSYNNRHAMHMVLSDQDLRRNPWFAAERTWQSCPDHEAGCRVFRISPPEQWREVRLQQRKASGTGDRTPRGYLTSGSGALIYRGDALPEAYLGNAFTGAAANNLVHRDILVPDGATFIARRAASEQERDFLASPHLCFRPVAFGEGPDGSLYVVDMCREIIETPLSVPPDIRKTMNFASGRHQGRIWRIRARDTVQSPTQSLEAMPSAALVPLLAAPNGWTRSTAQRLLVERQDVSVEKLLIRMAVKHDEPRGRLHALATLDGLSRLDEPLLVAALKDEDSGVRERAVQLAFRHLDASTPSPALIRTLLGLFDDESVRMPFEIARILGELPSNHKVLDTALALAERHADDLWVRSALLSNSPPFLAKLWQKLIESESALLTQDTPGAQTLIRELVSVAMAADTRDRLTPLLERIVDERETAPAQWHHAALQGLNQGISRMGPGANTKLNTKRWPALLLILLEAEDAALRKEAESLARALTLPDTPEVRTWLDRELEQAEDFDLPEAQRLRAIARAACGPETLVIARLAEIFTVYETLDIQRAIVDILAATQNSEVGSDLLDDWSEYTPGIRKVLVDALSRYQVYLPVLLAAMENETIPAWSVPATLRQRLVDHPDPTIARRAQLVFEATSDADQETYLRYAKVLKDENVKPDLARGRTLFSEQCASCHKFAGMGTQVGPDLNSVLGRSPEQLLGDVLLPSQTITVGYEYYVVDMLDGASYSGVIANESATSITIREQEGKESTLLRANIDRIYASRLSMMPENLHETVSADEMADLIGFILDQRDTP